MQKDRRPGSMQNGEVYMSYIVGRQIDAKATAGPVAVRPMGRGAVFTVVWYLRYAKPATKANA